MVRVRYHVLTCEGGVEGVLRNSAPSTLSVRVCFCFCFCSCLWVKGRLVGRSVVPSACVMFGIVSTGLLL